MLNLGGFSQTVGSLAGAGSGPFYGNSNSTVTNNGAVAATLTVGADNASSIFSGVIQDGTAALSLTKIGGGTLTLTNANAYSGVTALNAGTLAVASSGGLGTGVLSFGNGVLQANAFGNVPCVIINSCTPVLRNAVALNSGGTVDTNGSTLALSGPIAGPGGLTKIGQGTLTITGANSYSGGTALNAGTLEVGSTSALGTGTLTFNAGTLRSVAYGLVLGNAVSLNNAATIDAGVVNTLVTSLALTGPISGQGSLTKVNSGTLTLSGANSYRGGTVLAFGTIAAGSNSALGSGALTFGGGILQASTTGLTLGNAVSLGVAATVDTNGNNLALTGPISGTGSLAKIGTGALTLSGNSFYGGGTALNAGTLAVGSSTALGTGPLAFNAGALQAAATSLSLGNAVSLNTAATVDSNGNNLALTGPISGAGSLAKVGAGTLTLSGTNTYTLGTALNAGTLAVGSNAALGTGALAFNAGTLQAAASGLALGNAVALNAAGAVDSNGNSLALTGPIFGSGSLAKIGAGTLILTGPSSYTGGTVVSAGVLQGNTTSLQGGIQDNGTLVFDQAVNGTYSSVLSGSGAIVKQNSGTLVLTGDSSPFTGSTTITGGALEVGDGGTASAVLGGSAGVASAGTLFGHGTIRGSLTNSGTVTPGGTIGTLTVGGNFVQSAGGTFAVEVAPTGASRLAVGGAATLAGTIVAMPDPGIFAAGSRFPVLTAAGGISGTFGRFVNTAPVLDFSVAYLPNEVDLVLLGTTATPGGGGTGGGGPVFVTNFRGLAQTGNRLAVAGVLDQAFAGAIGDFATALSTAAFLPGPQVAPALSSLGGQIYADLALISLQNRRLFLGAMNSRLREAGDEVPSATVLGSLGAPAAPGLGGIGQQLASIGGGLGGLDPAGAGIGNHHVWVRGYGQFGGLDNSAGALGLDYQTGGGAVGADLIATPESKLGLAVGGGVTNAQLKTNPESATVSFVEFGVYGRQQLGFGAALDGAAIYAHDSYDVKRTILVPGLNRQASSSHDGNDGVADLGISRPLAFGLTQVTPRVGLSYFHIGQGDFSETGAHSLNLTGAINDFDALRSRIGASVSRPVAIGATRLLPEAHAAYTHDFLDNRSAFAASFAGAGALSFTQVGAHAARDAADLGLSLNLAVDQAALPAKLTAFVDYDATVSGHFNAQAVSAGLRFTW